MATTASPWEPIDPLRCRHCSALLARVGPLAVSIRRGGFEVMVTGSDATLQITCYRCRASHTVKTGSPLEHGTRPG
ncbi:MAG: hypothetical protein IPI49_19565 [Myxococcales bacterium]|nr:hypothetical protein [Myxococcales bacterium]